jgi:hypothetical protein
VPFCLTKRIHRASARLAARLECVNDTVIVKACNLHDVVLKDGGDPRPPGWTGAARASLDRRKAAKTLRGCWPGIGPLRGDTE